MKMGRNIFRDKTLKIYLFYLCATYQEFLINSYFHGIEKRLERQKSKLLTLTKSSLNN